MFLLDHVSITVKDIRRARPFYDAIMRALGVDKVYDREDALGYGVRCRANDDAHTYLAVYASAEAKGDTRRHWCFKASTHGQVIAFHEAALANGGRDDGAPGIRARYHEHYFGAFVVDTDGNRLEAVCHRPEKV
jgi:catechol 2,3-dioxygenase-like lactoylglutathione lyase family enzyme